MEIAVLALGCFWGPEIKFAKLDGVTNTEVGYCGGNTQIKNNFINKNTVCSKRQMRPMLLNSTEWPNHC